MKKNIVCALMVVMFFGSAFAKTYKYTVTGPLNDIKRGNIEKKLKEKFMGNVQKVTMDAMSGSVSVDGIENLNEADIKSVIASEGLTVK